MRSFTKKHAKWAAVPVLAVALLLGTAAGANATSPEVSAVDNPTLVTLAPGATGVVPIEIRNTGAGQYHVVPTSAAPNGNIVLQAPANTTFAPQTTVDTQFAVDGNLNWIPNNVTAINCVLSNGNKTLTCDAASIITTVDSGWPVGSFFRFNPLVTVDPTAPFGTTLTPGTSVYTFNLSTVGAGGAPYVTSQTSVGTLNVATPASAGTPMVDPLVGLGAGVLALGAAAGVVLYRRRRAGATA